MRLPRVWKQRVVLTGLLAVLSLGASASPAGAAVTIGEVADPYSGPDDYCTEGYDWVQPAVTGGNSYVVPAIPGIASLTLTSWTTWAGPEPNEQMTMKVFRAAPGQPNTYQAVGHAGPQTLTPGGTAGNTFPANIQVKAGDLLGLHASTRDWCLFLVPGETNLYYHGDIADNGSAPFTVYTFGQRLDIQAVVSPTNAFTIGAITRNKKKGTATIKVSVPNEGGLGASGKGVTATLLGPPSRLLIRARGKKKKTLNETGKVKLKVAITYTPTGGDPNTQPVKVKLKKQLTG
jgi:hypothetical protein